MGCCFFYLAVEGGVIFGAWWGCMLKGGEGEGAVSCCLGFLQEFFFYLWGGRRDLGGWGGRWRNGCLFVAQKREDFLGRGINS